MKTINEIQDEVIEEFSAFTEWLDKYGLLIEIGSELEPLPQSDKKPEQLIDGCQSRVWLSARRESDGRNPFRGDSEAVIVRGIVSLLIRVLSGHRPAEILSTDLYFIDRIGLREHLSPTRSNGLVSMLKQMRIYALAYQAQEENG